MKIETNWQSRPYFENKYSEDWARIWRIISHFEIDYTCLIGDEDYDSKIYIVLKNGDVRQSPKIYQKTDFRSLQKDELERDIHERARRPFGKHRQLLQMVFDEYRKEGEWPKTKPFQINYRNEGDLFATGNEINSDFIWMPDRHYNEGRIALTIYGILLCDGNSDYIQLFLSATRFIAQQYIETSGEGSITKADFIEAGIVSEENAWKIFDLMGSGVNITSSSSHDKGKTTFTLTPNDEVLKYEKIESIDDYIRIRYDPMVNSWGIPHSGTRSSDGEIHKLGIIRAEDAEDKNDLKYDLFISHASEDQEVAMDIKELAENTYELKCFLDVSDLKSGERWEPQIREALQESREVLILLTENSDSRQWVFAELGAAWALEKKIHPIMLRGDFKKLHPLISQFQGFKYSDIDRYLKKIAAKK